MDVPEGQAGEAEYAGMFPPISPSFIQWDDFVPHSDCVLGFTKKGLISYLDALLLKLCLSLEADTVCLKDSHSIPLISSVESPIRMGRIRNAFAFLNGNNL